MKPRNSSTTAPTRAAGRELGSSGTTQHSPCLPRRQELPSLPAAHTSPFTACLKSRMFCCLVLGVAFFFFFFGRTSELTHFPVAQRAPGAHPESVPNTKPPCPHTTFRGTLLCSFICGHIHRTTAVTNAQVIGLNSRNPGGRQSTSLAKAASELTSLAYSQGRRERTNEKQALTSSLDLTGLFIYINTLHGSISQNSSCSPLNLAFSFPLQPLGRL